MGRNRYSARVGEVIDVGTSRGGPRAFARVIRLKAWSAAAVIGVVLIGVGLSAAGPTSASSATTSFAFASNASGWVGAPTSGSWVASWDGATGNPAGALKSTVSGSGKTGTAITWTWSGSWTSLGVPSGATVLSVTLTGLDTKVTAYTGGTNSSFGTLQLQNGSGASQGTLWAGRSFSAVDSSWVAAGSQAGVSVPSAISDAASAGEVVTTYLDNIAIRVDYSTATGWSPVEAATVSGNPASRAYDFTSAAVATTVAVATTNTGGLTSPATQITVSSDTAAPTLAITAPSTGEPVFVTSTDYTVTFSATDTASGFGSSGWTLQRHVATATDGTCGSFGDDTAAGNRVTGTTSGPGQTSAQTLLSGHCYRWVLTAADAVGNVAAPITSGSILVDTTAPAAPRVTVTAVGGNAYELGTPTTMAYQAAPGDPIYFRPAGAGSVTLTAASSDDESGVNSLNFGGLSSAVGWTYTPAVVTANPASKSLGWDQTADSSAFAVTAANGVGLTSEEGAVTLVADSTGPSVLFSTPEVGITIQPSITATVEWTESDGLSGVASRSIQRQVADFDGSGCGSFVDDGTPEAGASPLSVNDLVAGRCYRWEAEVADDVGNVGAALSGIVAVSSATPTVSLGWPTEGGTLFATETLSAQTSGATFSTVDFIIDGVSVGTSAAQPYILDLDTTTLPNGSHVFKAIGHLGSGGDIETALVTATVDNSLTSADRLEADRNAGRITVDDYAIDGVLAIGAPQSAPSRYQSSTSLSDAHPLDRYLLTWGSLQPATQQAITEFLDQPLRGNLYTASQYSGIDTPTTVEGINDDCHYLEYHIVILGLTILDGHVDKCVHETAHFSITYQLNGTGSFAADSVTDAPISGVPALIRHYADGLEEAYDVYANQLQYPAWTGRDVVQVQRILFCNECGFTYPPGTNPAESPAPVIQLWPSAGSPFYLAHHELYHVFEGQLANPIVTLQGLGGEIFGSYEYRWWAEASADWGAGYVDRAISEPDHDQGQYSQSLSEFLGRPRSSLSLFEDVLGGRQYGAFVFAEYLSERLDAAPNPDVVKETWQRIGGNLESPLTAIANVVQAHGSTLPTLLPGFYKAAYLLDFDDHVGAGESDVESVWRGVRLAPDDRTEGDALAPARPAREQVQLQLGQEASGAEFIARGGAQYLELVPPTDAVGDLTVSVSGVARPELDARILTVAYTPEPEFRTVCLERSIDIGPDGNGTLTIPMSRACTHAVVVFTNTNPVDSPGSEFGWSASFSPLVISPVGIKLGDGRSMTVLDGKVYYIPMDGRNRLCPIDLATMSTETCGPTLIQEPEILLSLATAGGRLFALSGNDWGPANGTRLYEVDPVALTIQATIGSFGGAEPYQVLGGLYGSSLIAIGDDLYVGPMFDNNALLDVELRYAMGENGYELAATYAASSYAGLGWWGDVKPATNAGDVSWFATGDTYRYDRAAGGEPVAVFHDSTYPISTSAVYADGALWTLGNVLGDPRDAALLRVDPGSNETVGTYSLAEYFDYFEDIAAVGDVLYVLGQRTLIAVRLSDGTVIGQISLSDYGLGPSDSHNLLLWDSSTSRLYLQVNDAGVPWNETDSWASGYRLLSIEPAALGVSP
jgi:hypothetical protein